ncbi:hypothetical protein [Nitrosomonas mobilis]|uniref:hypothetical protein n=1 Tax=Nitrosomonas mobilis TaxID=51642 RepID=UPI001C40A7F1|nr:hypothetical protein [Nitrosomonas mobilis]
MLMRRGFKSQSAGSRNLNPGAVKPVSWEEIKLKLNRELCKHFTFILKLRPICVKRSSGMNASKRIEDWDFLHFEQVNIRFHRVGGVAVPQAMRRDSFLTNLRRGADCVYGAFLAAGKQQH